MQIAIDVSHYDDKVDCTILKQESPVSLVIAKTGYANRWGNWKDDLFDQHILGAVHAGLDVASYWWVDPTKNAQEQVDAYLKFMGDKLKYMKFVSLDVEQEKAWNLTWNPKHTRQTRVFGRVKSDDVSNTSFLAAQLLAREVSVPVVIYTRTSYLREYSPRSFSWVCNYPLWLAMYPDTHVYTCDPKEASAKGFTYCPTWDSYLSAFAPDPDKTIVVTPPGCDKWFMWQFTGDRVKLPGTGSFMDINYFEG